MTSDRVVSVDGWYGWREMLGGVPSWWGWGPDGRLGPFKDATACEKALEKAVDAHKHKKKVATEADDQRWRDQLASQVRSSKMLVSEGDCELWLVIFGDGSRRYVVVGPDGVEEIELVAYGEAISALAAAAARYTPRIGF